MTDNKSGKTLAYQITSLVEERAKWERQIELNKRRMSHGAWVTLMQVGNEITTQCTICKEEYTYKIGTLEITGYTYPKYNYCPNCGARMDGE